MAARAISPKKTTMATGTNTTLSTTMKLSWEKKTPRNSISSPKKKLEEDLGKSVTVRLFFFRSSYLGGGARIHCRHVSYCSKIVDKIDEDGDSSVTEKELEDWIRHVGRR